MKGDSSGTGRRTQSGRRRAASNEFPIATWIARRLGFRRRLSDQRRVDPGPYRRSTGVAAPPPEAPAAEPLRVFPLEEPAHPRAKASREHLILLGALVAVGGAAMLAYDFLMALGHAIGGAGGAWGRPLRIRGRILHPGLCEGSDWTRGDRPDASALDQETRAALEALWLHDAQKEHASVPAFSRVSWMLAAVGAPADLVEWAHRAAMEEIEHTRLCFALAAGYGGRSHTALAMPELLVGGLDVKGDPLVHLTLESLKDGCLLEDFNADVAGACELVCVDPVTKAVLGRIAVEERSHAELSWAMLAWLVERGGEPVRRALSRAIEGLAGVARPTAVSSEKLRLHRRADPRAMRAHGRLRDDEWESLWGPRVEATRARAKALLGLAPIRLATQARGRGWPRRRPSVSLPNATGASAMTYETPDFTEIKMDAEIGSYQNDFDPERDPSFVAPAIEAEVRDSDG